MMRELKSNRPTKKGQSNSNFNTILQAIITKTEYAMGCTANQTNEWITDRFHFQT